MIFSIFISSLNNKLHSHKTIRAICDQKQFFASIFQFFEEQFQTTVALDVLAHVGSNNFVHDWMTCAHRSLHITEQYLWMII